jgi:hypothetical protein
MYRFLIALLLAGCAGSMAPSTTAIVPGASRALTPLPGGGCHRRFVAIPRLALRNGAQVEIRTFNPNNAIAGIIVRNHLRTHSIEVWPTNDPSSVTSVAARTRTDITFSSPSRGIVVVRQSFGKDIGPGVTIGGIICPKT